MMGLSALRETEVAPRSRQAIKASGVLDDVVARVVLGMVARAGELIETDRPVAKACLEQAWRLLQVELDRTPAADPAHPGERLAGWQVKRITLHIGQNLSEKITIRDLAAVVHLTPGYFSRAFRGAFGMTAGAYVTQERLALARQLMLATDEPLSQIALACGFCDQAKFSRTFHRVFGAPPGAWRRLRRGNSLAARAPTSDRAAAA